MDKTIQDKKIKMEHEMNIFHKIMVLNIFVLKLVENAIFHPKIKN